LQQQQQQKTTKNQNTQPPKNHESENSTQQEGIMHSSQIFLQILPLLKTIVVFLRLWLLPHSSLRIY